MLRPIPNLCEPFPGLLTRRSITSIVINLQCKAVSVLSALIAAGRRDYVPAYHFRQSYLEWVVQLMIQWDTDAIAFPSERASKP